MKTKVLVTGANGQLAHTIRELYFVNDDSITFTFVTKDELDITNSNSISNFFSINKYDYCINCAAYTNVEQAEESIELAFNINAEALKNIALLCKKHNTRLIHISTDYVFDGKKDTPYLETDITNPINQYGKSKLKGELYIRDILDQHYIIRTSWLYSSYKKNFVKSIVDKIKENADLKITVSEKGTPTSCIDLAKLIYQIVNLKTEAYGTYHFSNEGEATWYDFAKQIAKHFEDYNLNKLESVVFFKTKAERPKYSVLSKSKIISNFNFRPINWKDALTRILDAF